MSETSDKKETQLKVLLMEVGKAGLREQVGFNEFHYNLALGYLARAARAKAPKGAGIPKDNIRIFFQFHETDEEMILRAVQFDPDVIGFTCYTNNWPATEKIAREIKQRLADGDKNRKRWFLIGGVHATTSYSEIFDDRKSDGTSRSPFDLAVLGEGEKTFVELLKIFTGNPSHPNPSEEQEEPLISSKDRAFWPEQSGVAFPKIGKNRRVVIDKNGAPECFKKFREDNNRLEDLDEYCDEVDKKTKQIKYGPVRPPASFNLPKNVYPAVPGNPPFASISFSRGCKGKCTFCSNHKMYPGGPRFRKAEHVFAEMMRFRTAADAHGAHVARDWYVDDEDVFSNPDELWKLCGCLKAENARAGTEEKITWMGLASIGKACAARKAYSDWFQSLSDSGCVMLGFGLESGDSASRTVFHKGFTDGEAERVVTAAFDAGIIPVGFFLLGTPDETIESLKATFALASRLKCLRYRFSYLYPYPGTELRTQIKWLKDEYAQPEYAAQNIPVVRCKATNRKNKLYLTEDEFAATGSAFLNTLYESDVYAKNVNEFLNKNPSWEYSIRVNWRGIVANDIISGHNPNAYKSLEKLGIILKDKAEGTSENERRE